MQVRRAVLAALPVLLLLGRPAAAAPAVTVTGTYERLVRDVLGGDPVYDDVLHAGGHHYRLRLPPGRAPLPGTLLTVTASRQRSGRLSVTAFRALAPPAARPAATTPRTTRVLVVLAYWTAPDAVTTARARQQILGDDNTWFRETSYGTVSLTGSVTPWVRIAAPAGGRCYDHAAELMAAAQAKAKGLGYDATGYDRTILYFPRCAGADTKNVAGWAYEPGSLVWLNGFMDRRTSVHEQGHNEGMGHARGYACTSAGVRVTLGGTCARTEYGDPYDAMGESSYAAHPAGYNKDLAGWLGNRKRVLAQAATTFTLPPYEQVSATLPQVVVANSPVAGRAYWLEYRRAAGVDAALPAGATGGVLVHLQDNALGGGQWLLDGTPGDATFATSVVRAGTSWTAPDGVRIAVGSATATGVGVTVTGAKPLPTPPSAVRSLTATAGDTDVELRWVAPATDGGDPVTTYTVDVTQYGSAYRSLSFFAIDGPRATVTGLGNDVAYTFTVRAGNGVGRGPGSTVSATPVLMPPAVRLVSPEPGATVRGTAPLDVVATPHPVSGLAIAEVSYYLDGYDYLGRLTSAPWRLDWDTRRYRNGAHTIEIVTRDTRYRTASTGRIALTVDNPVPSVAVTSPADGTSVDAESLAFEATASVPEGHAATIARVEYLLDGWSVFATATVAPYRASLDIRWFTGAHTVVATAYDSAGLSARSAPVSFTVVHPPPTARVTAPLDATTVTGPAVPVTVDAAARTAGATVREVAFAVDGGRMATDQTAPYEWTWDTSGLTGSHVLSVAVIDSNGRAGYASASRVVVGNTLPAVTVVPPPATGAWPDVYTVDPVVRTFSGRALAAPGGAPVERVAVTMDNKPVESALADDGVWTAPYDAAGRYGRHTLVVTAYDTAGLRATANLAFDVRHPAPVATFTSPAADAVLVAGRTYEVAADVRPGRYDPASVLTVCFYRQWGYGIGCGTRGDDGVYRVPWTVDATTTYQHVVADVRLSDGYTFTVPGPLVTVVSIPTAPVVSAKPGSDGTVEVSWTGPPESSPAAVTGYVIGEVGGEPRTVTGPGPVTFSGLSNGVRHLFSVAAVNAAGTGPPGIAGATPGTPTFAGTQSWGPDVVSYGARVTVTAAPRPADDPLSGVIAGHPVELLACSTVDYTACPVVARAVTDGAGVALLSFVPTREVLLRVRFPGGGRYLASQDDLGVVRVAARVTGTLSAATVRYGATAYLSGVVSPVRPGGFVMLQRLDGRGWHDVTYRTESATGVVRVPLRLPRGTYVFRLYYGAESGRLAGASPRRTFTVRS
jgi:hypothetical protein